MGKKGSNPPPCVHRRRAVNNGEHCPHEKVKRSLFVFTYRVCCMVDCNSCVYFESVPRPKPPPAPPRKK